MMISINTAEHVDLEDLAARVNRTCPELDERGRRVALATYRALGFGTPVPDYAVAAAAGLDIVEIQDVMRAWPGIYRNDSGRIIGFWGLSLEETAHPMVVDDVRLHGWCAWDTLFIPRILGAPAAVESACGLTGETIRIEVDDKGATADPPSAVVSFVDPGRCDVDGERIISTFCHHILFFSGEQEGEEWVRASGDGVFVLALAEAFELGRAFNRLRFGLD